jgi:hypothetical protein
MDANKLGTISEKSISKERIDAFVSDFDNDRDESALQSEQTD